MRNLTLLLRPSAKIFVFSITGLTLLSCSGEQSGDGEGAVAPSTLEVSESGSEGWAHPVTPWGDPDLQGVWPIAHLIATPFQRPEEYGDRLFFSEEEIAEQQERVEARNTRYEEEDATDRIGMGHWAEPSSLPTQTSLLIDPPNGRFPAMTEEGERLSATLGSSWGREDFDSPLDFDTWDRCITRGLPVSMFPFNYNNGIQMIQTPGYVVINMEMIHEARIVRLGDAPALDSEVKQWLGDSRGWWEGDVLVVETTNFNGVAGMTNVGIPGSPSGNHATSTELKLTERFERVSDDVINYEITVEDPVTLAQSWTAAFPWKRDDNYQFFEYACNEDNYTIRDFITTSRFRRAKEAGEI